MLYFSLQTLQFLLVEAQKYFVPGRKVPLILHWSRYECPFYVIMGSGTGRLTLNLSRGGEKSINHGTGLTEIVWKRRCSVFYVHACSPRLSAMLTRNERYFGQFRNSKSMACLS